MSSHATFAALTAVCALGAAGCEATFTPAEPVVAFYGRGMVAPVTAIPTNIWSYPRVFYGGNTVFLVNGYWYEQTPRGWVVFRREPPELSQARIRIYASPRGRTPPPGYGYPAQEPYEYQREPAPLEEPYEFRRERRPNP